MIENLRALVRLPLVVLATGLVYAIWLLGTLALLPFRRLRMNLRDVCFRIWGKSLLRLLNAKIETRGRPPEAPFLLVANHLGYVDIMVLAAHLDAVFVAKSEIASWPIFGVMCRSFGTIFVDRNLRRDLPRVIAEIDRVLAEGRGVVLFPEGTSTPGYEVAQFRPALLEVAARARRPVTYAALGYRTADPSRPAHLAVAWWGGMSFVPHFWRLLGLSGFSATVAFGDEAFEEVDRKRLAESLRAAVESRFEPLVERDASQASSKASSKACAGPPP